MVVFDEARIPDENLIGFACDGASVMVGDFNSVISRLRIRCPGIILMKCVCHSLHLAAKSACKCLPKVCEDMARNIYSFFKHSNKRVAQFREFQEYLDIAAHKMLTLSLTRWLCLRENVDRILEQWEALRLYLTQHRLEDNTGGTEHLFVWLNDPIIKAYFLFLSWVLPKVTTLNAYFQHSKVVVTSLHEKMCTGYKEMLQSFMKPTYLARTDLTQVDPLQKDQFVPLSNLYLGVKVQEHLKHPQFVAQPDKAEIVRRCCRAYMVELCKGIRDRYNFNDPLLAALPVLKPRVAVNVVDRSFSNSILPFADLVPRAKPGHGDMDMMQRLDDEWRLLPLDDIPRDFIEEEHIDVFWARIGKLTNGEGELKYAVLSEFVLAVLSLPHSNADVERIFSKVTGIKTQLRNRLITKTIEGLCLSSECVKGSKNCCAGFEPTPTMLASMTSERLYGPKTPGKRGAAEAVVDEEAEPDLGNVDGDVDDPVAVDA